MAHTMPLMDWQPPDTWPLQPTAVSRSITSLLLKAFSTISYPSPSRAADSTVKAFLSTQQPLLPMTSLGHHALHFQDGSSASAASMLFGAKSALFVCCVGGVVTWLAAGDKASVGLKAGNRGPPYHLSHLSGTAPPHRRDQQATVKPRSKRKRTSVRVESVARMPSDVGNSGTDVAVPTCKETTSIAVQTDELLLTSSSTPSSPTSTGLSASNSISPIPTRALNVCNRPRTSTASASTAAPRIALVELQSTSALKPPTAPAPSPYVSPSLTTRRLSPSHRNSSTASLCNLYDDVSPNSPISTTSSAFNGDFGSCHSLSGHAGNGRTSPSGSVTAILPDDVPSLVAEIMRLRQVLSISRSANRKLEAKLRMVTRRRDALIEAVGSLKVDVRTERESRFVIERCLQERTKRMELELEFKEIEIAELRDRRRELEDWVGFENGSLQSGGSPVSFSGRPSLATKSPEVNDLSVKPTVPARSSSSTEEEEGYGSEESFEGPGASHWPRGIGAPSSSSSLKVELSPLQTTAPPPSPDAPVTEFVTPSPSPPVSPAVLNIEDDGGDSGEDSDEDDGIVNHRGSQTSGRPDCAVPPSPKSLFTAAVGLLQQEFVSDVSPATAQLDLEELIHNIKMASNSAVSDAGSSVGYTMLDAIVEALARLIEVLAARAAVVGTGRKATASNVGGATVSELVQTCVSKYASLLTHYIESPADELQLLYALERASLRPSLPSSPTPAPNSCSSQSVGAAQTSLCHLLLRSYLHVPFLLSLYKEELIEPPAVSDWFRGPPSACVEGSVSGEGNALREGCRSFVEWLESEDCESDEEDMEESEFRIVGGVSTAEDGKGRDEADFVKGDSVEIRYSEDDEDEDDEEDDEDDDEESGSEVNETAHGESWDGSGDEGDVDVEFGKRVTFGDVVAL
ncbi:hypothetical protein DFJ73DRAFT_507115 [Zopfochytrium polystomum]|nr:hypothetical protein DFJ73DRAFT_507115 [Zopfochytrium polystomum]